MAVLLKRFIFCFCGNKFEGGNDPRTSRIIMSIQTALTILGEKSTRAEGIVDYL